MIEAARTGDGAALELLAVRHMDRARRIYEAKFFQGSHTRPD